MEVFDNGLTPEQSLFDWVPVGLVRLDAAGVIVAANPALLAWLGYEQVGQLVGGDFSALFASQEELARWKAAIEREEAVVDFGFTCLRPDGKQELVRLDARRVRHQGGDLVYLEASLQSIEPQKRAEQTLAYARELAASANRMKNRFTGKASHDLLTPLNSILGFSQLLTRDPALSTDQLSSVAAILRAGRALLARINEIREFVLLESGRMKLQESSFDLIASTLPPEPPAADLPAEVEPPTAAQPPEALSVPPLHAGVPLQWVTAMQHCLLLGAFLDVQELIEAIRPKEPDLADVLTRLANRFAYDQIEAVVQTLPVVDD